MYSVLLVDDEPLAIEGMQLFVDWEEHGFRVCGVCQSGEEALEAIGRVGPDVVVTDIRMPVMNGLDLIDRIRNEDRQHPEFVIVSGYSEFPYAKRALILGINHYLLKPIIREEAAEVLRKVRLRLESSRQRGSPVTTAAAIPGESRIPFEAVRPIMLILEAIERLNPDKASAAIRQLFDEIGTHSPEWVGMLVSHLEFQCARLLQELGGEPSGLLRRPGTEHSSHSGTPEGILAYANEVMEEIRALQARNPGGTMAVIDRYIQENYRAGLSIKQIASLYYLNPVYLGKAYQDKHGFGLLDRIHDLRIEEAKRLLRETDFKTSTIAEEVGYGQYNYFLQQFEMRVRMKPSIYRSMAR
ncbi:hypothetical protein Back11_38840 [Paenibacillus baekrokdamisoli]|uniref:Uncharacterized protein n=1 Tax=Paenibacillus baekrokdamisoli TaxID=1712516 RepID=A0A3G9JHP2_9BACL|nr:response regulator [Paenibacillus baekrokdamisoli]MBB3068415.1 two-component system response regulator YesN [Paenibacillus baekrokdamisoli]BBH22539.1 hypothetical protein Back11_38840 [Paenibacillus baekrokdamisoli]